MGASCTKSSNLSGIGASSSQPIRAVVLPQSNEVLTFNVVISNIKARNLPPTADSVKIIFGHEKELLATDVTVNSMNYFWKFSREFDYTSTRQNLRTEDLKIIILEKSGKEIGEVLINLYDIATGPVHQDFTMKMKKGYKEPGRVNLDVKMSQMIQIRVKAQNVCCHLKENLKEKFYNFSLKMNAKDQEFSSDHSVNFKNIVIGPIFGDKVTEELKDENFQPLMEENKSVRIDSYVSEGGMKNYFTPHKDNDCSIQDTSGSNKPDIELDVPLRSRAAGFHFKNKNSVRLSVAYPTWGENKDVKWDFVREHSEVALSLEVNVNVRDLANGSFQFFLWANKEMHSLVEQKDDPEMSVQEVYIDHKLVGECYIGMNKFFFGDAEINFGEDKNITAPPEGNNNGEKPNQSRLAQFEETLWFHGLKIGELKGDFVVQSSAFYRQMICGVRTEEGIQRSSALYLNKDKHNTYSKNTNIKEIKMLEQYRDSLKTVMFNFSDTENNPRARIKIIDELATTIHKVLEILKSTHKESTLSFLYKSPEELLASQRIFIGIAKHLLDYADEVPHTLRPVYYECLLLLMNRGELELNFMGFDEGYAELLLNTAQKISFKTEPGNLKSEMKNIQRKLEVCEKYQALLYQTLRKVLDKLSQKALPSTEREFVEQFSAIAYFRIPEFRKTLLKALYDSVKDITIDEWRGTEWKLDEVIDDEKKNQQFLALFDWENDFYVYLKNTENGEKNYKFLNEILNDEVWKNRMKKRGIAFFFFLIEWAKHVNKTVVIKEHIPWQDLPGYRILLKALLAALKKRDVKSYPEVLTNASNTFLKNEKLLNTFIVIIYNKTSVYDSSSVFAVYEIINTWFTLLRENGKAIPATFDYSFFFKGVHMILESDHALNISKVLWMIYNNFNILPYNQKQILSEVMFGPLFFKLFLHWSWNVRQVFHSLLLYRFYHQHRTTNTNLQNLDDLKKELLLYNQKRKNLNQTKKLLVNDLINMKYSRNLTIIENGYKKMKEQQAQRKSAQKPPAKRKSQFKHFSHELKIPERIPQRVPKSSRPAPDGMKRPQKNEFSKLQLRASQSESHGKDILNGALDRSLSRTDSESKLQDLNQSQNGSYWMINPDKLDLSIQDIPKRPQRSGSMSLVSNFMQSVNNVDKSDNFEEIDALIGKKEPEEQKVEKPRDKLIDLTEESDERPDKKKVIHRRIIYFDKQTQQIQEIPEQYTVYLEAAYQEYEKAKEQYLIWLNVVEEKFKSMKEEEIRKFKADPKVPEIFVAIPRDEVVPEPDQD